MKRVQKQLYLLTITTGHSVLATYGGRQTRCSCHRLTGFHYFSHFELFCCETISCFLSQTVSFQFLFFFLFYDLICILMKFLIIHNFFLFVVILWMSLSTKGCYFVAHVPVVAAPWKGYTFVICLMLTISQIFL